MTTTRGGREREREERTKKKRRRRRKTALSSEEEGETSSDDDDDEEEEEEDEEEELENRTRKGGRGRGKLPSKETIRNAFEELCRCEEAGKKEGEEEDGFTLQNLLDLCAKYGYHDWTLAEIENMLDAYDLSEARGEKKISDPEGTTKTVLVTESGFLEIVRKCGVREL